jgi:hypothetical protein
MKIDEFNKSKIPLVKIDERLNRFKGKVLFKEKLDRANKLLENVELPKIVREKIKKASNKS